MRKIHIAIAILAMTCGAKANWSVVCSNPGLCQANICIEDPTKASGECQKKCGSMATATAASSSQCTPGSSAPEVGKPVAWQSKINACTKKPTPEQWQHMITGRNQGDTHVDHFTERQVCMNIPKDMMVTDVYCHADDAYSNGWCEGGMGSAHGCDVQYAWPVYVSTEQISDGTQDVCIVFYNQSDNRWREFDIGGEPITINNQ